MSISSMRTMTVEQAVFASADRGKVKGYQLISKSSGIDRKVAQELCRWAPTQVPSDDPAKWMINYFPVSDDFVAVTRTVLGGPEYSSRGGTQVVTLILLLRRNQLSSYDFNPIAFARTAMVLGYLRLPLDMSQEHLPLAALPSRPILEGTDQEDDETQGSGELLNEIAAMVKETQRVAVIGLDRPIDAAEQLVRRLPLEQRREFSFTTGLSPTVRRPFQTHFLSAGDVPRQRTLEAQGIVPIDASSVSTPGSSRQI